MSRGRTIVLFLCLAGLPGDGPFHASRPRTFEASPTFLSQGVAQGVAVSARGRLFAAPQLVRLDQSGGSIEPAQVWSAVIDSAGTLFLGTGPEGQIVKIDSSGRRSVHHRVDEPIVSALALTPQGDLLAGTAPGGKIYRIRPDGRAELFSDTGENYVWSLAVGAQGQVFAGTGERGAILEIGLSGAPTRFFDSAETHITTLLMTADGDLIAGGAGRGLVYRINRDGNGLVLHDDDLVEVAALLRRPDGSLVAALLAPAPAETQRPAVELRLPDGVRVGATTENVGSLEEASGPTIRGVIEGLLPELDPPPAATRGRLVSIDAEGRVAELWHSREEAPFALLQDEAGNILFGTGEPGRLYRVDAQGDVALLETLLEGQLTEIFSHERALYVATSNPAAVYRVQDPPDAGGSFVSPPIDAGATARWGTLRWHSEAEPRFELYTRTGNSRDPDDTWSAWGPRLTRAEGSPIDNPDGRFLQWRARFNGPQADGVGVSGVSVSYENYNRAPQVRELRIDGRSRALRERAEIVWSATDPDDDPVTLSFEYRDAPAAAWKAAGVEAPAETAGQPPAPGWRTARASWPLAGLDEGAYELRALATDQPANAAGEGQTIVVEPRLRLIVDRTAPAIDIGPAANGAVEVRVTDALAAIERVELLRAGELRSTARPVDGVCDSPREAFRIRLVDDGAVWTLRAFDEAGNRAELPLPAP